MEKSTTFAEVLETVDRLSDEDQEVLVEIVRRRIAELGRKRLIGEALEAQREFTQGDCLPISADDLMSEILL
jgi:hypothetical protein